MKLFSNSTSYLGIDIGTSSIKMVELENFKGQAKLKTYGYSDVSTNVLHGTAERNNEIIANYIDTVATKSKVQTRQVVAALPTFSVFNFIITLPPMPKKDLAAAIKWEAKKFIPVPIEEMILDWKILNKKRVKTDSGLKGKLSIFDRKKKEEKDEEGKDAGDVSKEKQLKPEAEDGTQLDKNYRILLTAAPKSLVARYIDIFRRANMNLLSLETEAFALSRSLMGNDMSTVMIVDVGATTADICIIEQGVPILNRGIDTGGEFITKTIMNSMNINQDRAEQFKRDFGLSSESNKKIPDVIQKSLNSIVNEVRYVFEMFESQGDSKIDKVVLTGGSAFLPNFPEYLSELLNLSVIIGNPWDRIIYPLDLEPILHEIGPRMSISIGLAMRDI